MTEIIRELRNGVALITLNRPAALNALSLEMISNLTTVLRACVDDKDVRAVLIKGAGGKAFCAGGDIRALYQSFRAGDTLHCDFFSAEYTLDYFLRFYPKPYIALMDGITLGGGMGIAQGSPLRIVGDRTRAAMPEVGIGFFPDVGASFFLARAPGEVGVYLGLTGAQILAADCLYANLADAYLPKDSMERLQGMLTQIRWSADPATDLKRVIEAFAQLQEDRHTADYDVAVIWSRVDVMFSLTTAEQAFAAWKRIRNEKVARDHLLTMFGARRG